MAEKLMDIEFVVGQWNSQTVYHRLLEHMLNRAEVDHLSLAQRHAAIYGYSRQAHFREAAQREQRHILALGDIERRLQKKPAIFVTDAMYAIIDFLKTLLTKTRVFCVPMDLFNLVSGNPRRPILALHLK